MDLPTLEQLECLIRWPAGSLGEERERALLAVLLAAANTNGLGRLQQLVDGMEEIWRAGPGAIARFEAGKAAYCKSMTVRGLWPAEEQ